MSIAAYPLTWPTHIPRHRAREAGRFKTTLATALKNVQESLRLFASDSGKALTGLTISSNVTLGAQKPADPGVAVWFTWDNIQVSVPVDRYTTVEANLQAIHHIIEARRVELRHGTLALVKASFQGFKALPAPVGGWRAVLAVSPDATLADAKAAHRRLSAEHHPDRPGGNQDRMAEINQAWSDAEKEFQ